MSSSVVNSFIQNLANKPPLIDRTHHYNGPSGSIHHFHSSHHHSGSKGSGKHGIALTALTLLSFLFFLNILQNCLQEHMDSMNPQVMIMQARTKELREIEAQKRKGEVQPELFNSSYGKESRNKPELKSQNYHLTQIPVKLRTNEKAVKP